MKKFEKFEKAPWGGFGKGCGKVVGRFRDGFGVIFGRFGVRFGSFGIILRAFWESRCWEKSPQKVNKKFVNFLWSFLAFHREVLGGAWGGLGEVLGSFG